MRISDWSSDVCSSDLGFPAPKPRVALDLPGDLGAALKANAAAQGHWDAFSPGKRRDYIEWVIEAKREDTRIKRIDTIVAQVAEGKDRNWKYKGRSEEHTSELQSLMRISYAVFCLKK